MSNKLSLNIIKDQETKTQTKDTIAHITTIKRS